MVIFMLFQMDKFLREKEHKVCQKVYVCAFKRKA